MPENKFFMYLHNPNIGRPQGSVSNWHCRRSRSAPFFAQVTLPYRRDTSVAVPLTSRFCNIIISEENLRPGIGEHFAGKRKCANFTMCWHSLLCDVKESHQPYPLLVWCRENRSSVHPARRHGSSDTSPRPGQVSSTSKSRRRLL